jgi:hypothetical protein
MLGLAGLCSQMHRRQEELRAPAGRPLLTQPSSTAPHKDWTTDDVSPGAGVSSFWTDIAPRVWHAGQQQDAADEVRAPRWRPSPLILVFDGRIRVPR